MGGWVRGWVGGCSLEAGVLLGNVNPKNRLPSNELHYYLHVEPNSSYLTSYQCQLSLIDSMDFPKVYHFLDENVKFC